MSEYPQDLRARLYRFYDVRDDDALIACMEKHIERLCEKLNDLKPKERIRTVVREG